VFVYLFLKLPKLWMAVYIVFQVRGELVKKALFVEISYALEILDMAEVSLLVSGSRSAIDGEQSAT
jgi:hypothetical protein